jgi:hypothetical protein
MLGVEQVFGEQVREDDRFRVAFRAEVSDLLRLVR